MTQNNRPLSPHLQVYRLPLTGIISITHRLTGIFLSVGLIFFIISFFVLLEGQQTFQSFQALLTTPVGTILGWLYVYALFFHLCHGIRHLLWDIGLGFKHSDMNRNALIEIVCSLLLTLIFY